MGRIIDNSGDYLVDSTGNYISLPADFAEEVQRFSTTNLVELYEIDCTNIGGEILRFTASAYEDGPVVFKSQVYSPIPVVATGFEISSSGTLPAPTLKVLNVPSLQAGVIALNDMLGATVYRIKTFKTFLDDGDSPDETATFPVDVFTIDRKVGQNKVFIEWELAAAIDQEGRTIPARQVIKDFCTHIYRRYDPDTGTFDYTKATCPYADNLYFDEKDQAVSASQDRCGKRLSSCKMRFGNNSQLPTRAFPGVAKVR